MQTTDFHIRTFRDGDENEIIQLFEKCYGDYAGYVLRTREYWRWCCLDRPDVERKGLLVATTQADDRLLGYVVVGKSGNIWELGYDGEESGKEVVGSLLEGAVQYLTSVGASSVTVHAPVADDVVRVACAGLGLAETKPPTAFVSLLDFQELLYLLASDGQERLEGVSEMIEVVARDAPRWIRGRVRVKISDGVVRGVEDAGQKPTISLETDFATLSALIFRETGPFRALITRKMRVRPFWKLRSVLSLLSALRLEKSWFVPLSDYG